jgi:hypothetical protein
MEFPVSQLDLSSPCWDDYRSVLQRLTMPEFPTADELSALLPAGLHSHGGRPIRLVPASEIPDVAYEQHIFRTGQVSTRAESWHDLFNALVWSRFPRFKSAMNAMHVAQQNSAQTARRGRLRDALTLMDESGAIVISPRNALLAAIARHDWHFVFESWFSGPPATGESSQLKLFVCGHALLEKFLQPYKAMTAKVLLLVVDEDTFALPREKQLAWLDNHLAAKLLEGRLFNSPADLAPLPLMGIPGWWPLGDQDEVFYADMDVFRPLGDNSNPAPVLSIPL